MFTNHNRTGGAGGLASIGRAVVKIPVTGDKRADTGPRPSGTAFPSGTAAKHESPASRGVARAGAADPITSADGTPDDQSNDSEDADWPRHSLSPKCEDNHSKCGHHRAESMSNKNARSKEEPSVLAALLPGSEIRDPSHRILVNTAASKEMVTFNIGGTVFKTYRSTLRKLPESPLANESFLKRHYQEDQKQYFFDRDPEVFGAILNYLRTGELHLPTKYCGPAVKTEMEFWGINEDEIEECCWTSYSAWTTTLEALKKLEKDRKVNMPGAVEQFLQGGEAAGSKLRQIRVKGWTLLNSPHSSLLAQIYSYLSLTFVVVSIFSFIAQTHEAFRVPVKTPDQVTTPSPAGRTVPTTTTFTSTASSSNSTDMIVLDDVHPALLYVDAVCLVFFLLEFTLRLVLSPRKFKLLLLPMTIFELLALLPDLIEFTIRIFNPTLRTMAAVDVITFLRLLRVFRIFRLMRHFPGLWILFYTLKASVKELLLLLMFLCVGMLFFASLIYYTDNRATFTSIPMACWWSIITMTTVGYGDIHPSSPWGYVVGSVTAVCGVLVIGFTVPVLVNNFILYYQHTQSAICREGAKTRRAEVKRTMKEQDKWDGDPASPSDFMLESTSKVEHNDTSQTESELCTTAS